VESVPLLATLAPGTAFHPISFPVKEGWSRFNPSIVRLDGGFLCVVRSSNTHIQNGRYVFLTGGFPMIGENYLAILDDDLQLRSVDLLRDETDLGEKYRSKFLGLGDLRLFPGPRGWQAVAVTNEFNPEDLCQQVLLDLQGNRLINAVMLSTPEAGHQKNWMPVLGAALPTLVTHCSPTTVVRIDVARQLTETLAEHPAPAIAKHFRGGSQLVPLSDGYVCVIHETIRGGGFFRRYVHRLVHFTPTFRIDAISPQFVFHLLEVEYCAGLALHDGRFLLGFGVNDAEAFIAAVPERELLDLLLPCDDNAVAPALDLKARA
jgi:hypothetical protein